MSQYYVLLSMFGVLFTWFFVLSPIHEFGHVFFARLFQIKIVKTYWYPRIIRTNEITFFNIRRLRFRNPGVKLDKEKEAAIWQWITMLFGGVFMNFIVAMTIIFAVFILRPNSQVVSFIIGVLFVQFVDFINMIPVKDSDGAKMRKLVKCGQKLGLKKLIFLDANEQSYSLDNFHWTSLAS